MFSNDGFPCSQTSFIALPPDWSVEESEQLRLQQISLRIAAFWHVQNIPKQHRKFMDRFRRDSTWGRSLVAEMLHVPAQRRARRPGGDDPVQNLQRAGHMDAQFRTDRRADLHLAACPFADRFLRQFAEAVRSHRVVFYDVGSDDVMSAAAKSALLSACHDSVDLVIADRAAQIDGLVARMPSYAGRAMTMTCFEHRPGLYRAKSKAMDSTGKQGARQPASQHGPGIVTLQVQ